MKDLDKPFWASKVFWFALIASAVVASMMLLSYAIGASQAALDDIAKEAMSNVGWIWLAGVLGKSTLDAVGIRGGNNAKGA